MQILAEEGDWREVVNVRVNVRRLPTTKREPDRSLLRRRMILYIGFEEHDRREGSLAERGKRNYARRDQPRREESNSDRENLGASSVTFISDAGPFQKPGGFA